MINALTGILAAIAVAGGSTRLATERSSDEGGRDDRECEQTAHNEILFVVGTSYSHDRDDPPVVRSMLQIDGEPPFRA